MKTNIKKYKPYEVLERVKSHARGFIDFPFSDWLVCIRSKVDQFNKFDDDFYHFQFTNFIDIYSGTTNTGAKGLKQFETYNPNGAAILQADRIIYDSHGRGISKGRSVFRQIKPWPYYRDNDKDNKAEELGMVTWGIIHAHVHDVKMGNVDEYKEFINGWSTACLVMNNGRQWRDFHDIRTEGEDKLTVCILNEW